MNYYIIKNRIKAFETELDTNLYDYQKLTDSQKAFYETNPRATLSEVLNMQLNEPDAIDLFNQAKSNKQSAWQSKLEDGYLSPATSVQMSLTTSVIDGQSVFDKAIMLAIDVPAKINSGMPTSTPYSLRAKDGSLISGSTLGMAYTYLIEITKIGAKVNDINGLLFDAETEADLDDISLNFEWTNIL